MLSSLRAATAHASRSLVKPSAMRAGAIAAQQERGFKCSVLGAAGGIGVACDLSHICSDSSCTGYTGDDLTKALDGCDLVVIPAGVPRKPGMTRDDLFNINAGIVKNLVAGCAKACPKAVILVISNPVNSTVPIAAEVLKQAGVYNPKKLLGVTTLDVCRARTFVAEASGNKATAMKVPVVGGHAGTTIVPLLSQAEPAVSFDDATRDALTHRIMFGGDEVVKMKAGGGSATLSMAFAGAEFADKVMAGLAGELVTECAFVESNITEAKFFASKVTLGKEGVETIHKIGTVNDYEKKLIADMMPDLMAQAEKGIKWAAEHK